MKRARRVTIKPAPVNRKVTVFALVALLAACPCPAESGSDGDARLPGKTGRISYHGISFEFDREVDAGRFANGDFWVAVPEGSEVVRITAIHPEFDGRHHGWEVNPAEFGPQGFDHRMQGGGFEAERVPALPYDASPGESIVKAISYAVGEENPRPVLQRAVVLTVLAEVPPDAGRGMFRPPYFGEAKPVYDVDSLKLDLLPSLSPPAKDVPTLEDVAARFQHVWLDHRRGWTSRSMHPLENMPDYGSAMTLAVGDAVLALMLDNPVEEKRQAAVNLVQWAIDLQAMYEGGLRWHANGGHMHGRKLPLALAAVLLDDDDMRRTVSQWEHAAYPARYAANVFQEDSSVYYSPPARRVLWGQPMEDHYWLRLKEDRGSRTARDPYGYIDGGDHPGGAYQYCCTSMTWKGTALALHLMPELREVWNYEPFLDYVDRWVNFGAWTLPDPYNLDNEVDADAGGRFPEMHGKNANRGDWGSRFADAMWDLYRSDEAVPMPHVEPYGGTFEGPVTVQLDSPHLESVRLHYTLDGSLPCEEAPEYEGSLVITENATLRVRAFKDGYEPSAANRAVFEFE